MAQILMVASGKGGTGKSTIATYTALELALKGYRVLLIELDAGMRSIDIISGITEDAVFDISDVLTGACSPEKAMIKSPYCDRLQIITAPYKTTLIGFENYKSFIANVKDNFDYIITDTRAGIGKPFETACTIADKGIIVVTPDIISVRDARIVSDEMFNAEIPDIRLIINKYSPETFKYSGLNDFDQIIDDVCARLLGVIPMSEKIASYAIKGDQLSVNDREKQIFKKITDRLLGIDSQIVI